MITEEVLDGIRQPEYTGENRCTPCTVVNVLIAGALGGLVGLGSVPAGIAVFALSVGLIYARGYLIPGTPTLTKRYFPDRVLRWFDKDPAEFGTGIDADAGGDVEELLQDIGVLEERPDAEDLSMTPDFRAEWDTEMDHIDEDGARRTLGDMLGVEASRISVLPRSRSFEVKVDGETAGTWESSEAFTADMAANRVLTDWVSNWTDLPVERRSGMLRGARVYLDWCPRCDGPVSLSEETVQSCCRSREVLALRCEDCGVRLFEIDATDVQAADA